MSDINEILKKNKKRALSLAVAAVFSAGIAGNMAGCTKNEKTQTHEEEENNYTGNHYSGGRFFWRSWGTGGSSSSGSGSGSSSGTSSDGSSISSGKSSSGSSKSSSSSKSSGYSGSKGGNASS